MAVKEYLSRAQTAAILGRTRSCVLTYHGKQLHPVKNGEGEWLYEREEVERYAAVLRAQGKRGGSRGVRAPGDLAREAFRMFDLGLPMSEIVASTSLEPAKVRELYAEYTHGYERPIPVVLTPDQQIARDKIQLEKEKLALQTEKYMTQRRKRREE